MAKMEYNALLSLRNSQGYQVLQNLWAMQFKKIVDATRKAGKQNKELNWRYFAGQQEGFEIAITQVERAIVEMEKEDENIEANHEAQEQVEQLLKKIKGDEK